MRAFIALLCSMAALVAMPAHALVEIETRTLSSGAELWVAKDSTLPVVSMQMRFEGGGSASDPQGKEGRAVIAARMLLEGAGTRDALAFKQALAEKAIELSISAGSDDVLVSVRCLRTHVPDALKLLADALARPQFDADAFARVKRLHKASLLSSQQSASYRASVALNEIVYAGHPYAANGLGDNASIDGLTIDDLRNYQQSVIAADRAGVVVSGALSMRDAKALLRAFFAELPEKTLDYVPTPDAELQVSDAVTRVDMPLPQSAIRMALPWVNRKHEDFYAAYVLQTALGGGVLHSYLGDKLRREEGLVYDVGAHISVRDASSILVVHAATSNEQAKDAIAGIQQVLRDAQQHGIGQKRCEETKQYIIGSLPLMVDSTGGLAAFLGMMLHDDLGTNYLKKREALFNDVSCEQVNEVASRLLDLSKLTVSVAGGAASTEAEGQ